VLLIQIVLLVKVDLVNVEILQSSRPQAVHVGGVNVGKMHSVM